MATMTGGEALVAALAAHGVDTIFGIPGTHNLTVYAAMDRHGIRHVSPRHEQGAGYAADGYARSSGRPGVCLTTTGPAILNAAAAAAQAYSDSVPVLFVSPGMPLRHPGRGNGLLHEIKDQSGAMAAILGLSHRVTSVEEIPLAVAQAWTDLTSGRPRPVHLEIPLDLLEEQADVTVVGPVPAAARTPASEPVTEGAAACAAARRPVLLVGGGAARAGGEAVSLAETVGAPIVSTANGKGIIPEDHPLFVGAGLQHQCVLDLMTDSDLVIAVGTEFAPSDWWIGLPDLSGKVLRVDVDPAAIITNVVPEVSLVGDAAITLRALRAQLDLSTPPDGARRAARWRDLHRAAARAEGAPWLQIMSAIAEALPRDAIVATDSAMACYYGALSNLPLYRPGAFLYPTGGGTLGFALPAGIGAKIAHPDIAVIAVQGDGGAMFTVAELASAAELGIALPVIVVDNGGYGEIRNEMADRNEPVHAVALGRADFPSLARSLGCHGVRVEVAELTGEIKVALEADRPTLIHIHEESRAAEGMS
ncbi:thiamine pyrophosphate-binding protein [Spirillospora sp. NPDC048819]|uniref:thiamine pyrophosphate-binding protein n=1 Tax=Spirillospora sp. NPDC048819 TaxID=3155268 RepID=UPI0033EE4818